MAAYINSERVQITIFFLLIYLHGWRQISKFVFKLKSYVSPPVSAESSRLITVDFKLDRFDEKNRHHTLDQMIEKLRTNYDNIRKYNHVIRSSKQIDQIMENVRYAFTNEKLFSWDLFTYLITDLDNGLFNNYRKTLPSKSTVARTSR